MKISFRDEDLLLERLYLRLDIHKRMLEEIEANNFLQEPWFVHKDDIIRE